MSVNFYLLFLVKNFFLQKQSMHTRYMILVFYLTWHLHQNYLVFVWMSPPLLQPEEADHLASGTGKSTVSVLLDEQSRFYPLKMQIYVQTFILCAAFQKCQLVYNFLTYGRFFELLFAYPHFFIFPIIQRILTRGIRQVHQFRS